MLEASSLKRLFHNVDWMSAWAVAVLVALGLALAGLGYVVMGPEPSGTPETPVALSEASEPVYGILATDCTKIEDKGLRCSYRVLTANELSAILLVLGE